LNIKFTLSTEIHTRITGNLNVKSYYSVAAGCLMTGTPWAADKPFVGNWKVNPSKAMLNDEMKVEVAGANRYELTFGPGQTDTIMADGSDQPALSGTTLSITVTGPKSWEVTRKMKGRRAPHSALDAFRRRQIVQRRLHAIFAQRFDIVLALFVRADGVKFRFSRHLGQPRRKVATALGGARDTPKTWCISRGLYESMRFTDSWYCNSVDTWSRAFVGCRFAEI
jgi:hypothetical protein